MYGNIMSLIYGDDFIDKNEIYDYAFGDIFENFQALYSVKNLILPATTLGIACYTYMFNKCYNLINVPKLPATTLANDCYDSMFQDCTSLTTAPELPATTLAESCYSCMFYGCTLLTTAPELPATTLAESCYSSMF